MSELEISKGRQLAMEVLRKHIGDHVIWSIDGETILMETFNSNMLLDALEDFALSVKPTDEVFEIDFGGHTKAKIQIKGNTLKVLAAMNGIGNIISLDEIKTNKYIENKLKK